jgi:hypothetical protein
MALETRTTSRVLDDLVAKLETLPQHHPDRPQLIRTILGLRSELADATPRHDLFAHTPHRRAEGVEEPLGRLLRLLA